MASKGLTLKQREFIRNYLLTRNAAEAARLAGYKKRADAAGHELLQHPLVKAAIEAHEAQVRAEFKLEHKKLIDELVPIAFDRYTDHDIGDILDWDGKNKITLKAKSDISKNALRGILSLKQVIGKSGKLGVSVQMKDPKYKVDAIKALGEHLGTWRPEKGDEGGDQDKQKAGGTSWDALSERVLKALESDEDQG